MNFLLNVIASIFATVLVLLAGYFASSRFRGLLTTLLARVLSIDVECVYPTKAAAHADINAELKRARHVVIFAGRGNELQGDVFTPILNKRSDGEQPAVRILLPTTERLSGHYDWTHQRESELAQFDHAYGNGLLRNQIEVSVSFFQPHVARGKVAVRRFSLPHLGRILVTDRFAYFTPYRSDAPPSESSVYKFRRDGAMYDNLSRLFDQIWDSCPSSTTPSLRSPMSVSTDALRRDYTT